MPENPSATSVSLLRRLNDPQDGQAWGDFASRYRGRILDWCLRRGLQREDAEDATQDLLVKVRDKIRTFRFDRARGGFRGWLMAVVRRAVTDLHRDRARRGRHVGDAAGLEQAEAVEDLLTRLGGEFDLEQFEEALE